MTNPIPKIAIIVGSTRPGRNGEAVARWVTNIAAARDDAKFELVDLADNALPMLDEPLSALATTMMDQDYTQPHTKAWSQKITGFDGFVFVTPEYNRGIPAVLKNALDYLYTEWANKAAGIVGYGGHGGTRATSQLRITLGELHVATVSAEVNLSIYGDFENFTTFAPAETHLPKLSMMLDQTVAWSSALQSLRVTKE